MNESTPVASEETRGPSYAAGASVASGSPPTERTLSRAERGFMRSSMVQLTLVDECGNRTVPEEGFDARCANLR